jgi:hypothetical protein
MIKQNEVFIDPVYVFVRDKVQRFESVLNRKIPEHIISQITYDLKQLYKDNAKYKYSVSAIIALLYYYKVISYKEALQLLSNYSNWKKRFKEVLRLMRSKTNREESKRKVVCPRCGKEGYLVVNRKYAYVSHYENGAITKCYIGRIKNN